MGFVIEFGLIALAAATTFAIGIYNSCTSSSKVSTPELNIADKVEAKKEEIETDLMVMLLKGLVTIAAKIQASESANQELLESMAKSTSAATAICTSDIINIVQSNIAELQTENSRINQTTAVNTQDGAYVETFPTTQQQGPQIYDTPAGQIEGPLINVFPWVQPEPQVHATPKTSIKNEPITGVPADTAKELGDSILWTDGVINSNYKQGDKTAKGREFTKHVAERANERGFDAQTIDNIIENNKAKRVKEIDEDGKITWRYQDNRGNTVITNEWGDKIVTVYSYPKSTNGGNYISKNKK